MYTIFAIRVVFSWTDCTSEEGKLFKYKALVGLSTLDFTKPSKSLKEHM